MFVYVTVESFLQGKSLRLLCIYFICTHTFVRTVKLEILCYVCGTILVFLKKV